MSRDGISDSLHEPAKGNGCCDAGYIQFSRKWKTPSLPRSGGEGRGEEALIENSQDIIGKIRFGFLNTSPSLRLSPRKSICGERVKRTRSACQCDRPACPVQGFNARILFEGISHRGEGKGEGEP